MDLSHLTVQPCKAVCKFSLGVVQVLEMKEIEEAKPAASSSGMQINCPIQLKHSMLKHDVAVMLVVVSPAVAVSQSLLVREDFRAEKPWELFACYTHLLHYHLSHLLQLQTAGARHC